MSVMLAIRLTIVF